VLRALEVYGGVLVDAGKRYHTCLISAYGKLKSAYLDKSRIVGYYKLEPENYGITRYFILYDSNNAYYDDVHRGRIPQNAREVRIEEFVVNPSWLRRVGNKYYVWLHELEEWDGPWSLCTAVDIYVTNIHPVYGVMD